MSDIKNILISNQIEIKNREEIIKSSPIYIFGGLLPYRYVICSFTHDVLKYATYRENMRLDNGIWIHDSFYWGNHFTSLEDAEKNFSDRARLKS